jgi:hypothetical protein
MSHGRGSNPADHSIESEQWDDLGVLVTLEREESPFELAVAAAGGEGALLGEWSSAIAHLRDGWRVQVSTSFDDLFTDNENRAIGDDLGPFESATEAWQAAACRLLAVLVLVCRHLHKMGEP